LNIDLTSPIATVIGAWIAALASAFAAILSLKTQEKVKSLEMANTVRELVLTSVSPILFGFGDSCDIARERLIGLLQMKGKHNQAVDEKEAFRLLRVDRSDSSTSTGWYLTETIYRLLEPMAYYKLLLRRLSSEILHLEPNIDLQYRKHIILFL
jgi:hypothetical protein